MPTARTPRTERRVRVATLVDPEDFEALTRLALEHERSVAAEVRLAIREYVNGGDRTPGKDARPPQSIAGG